MIELAISPDIYSHLQLKERLEARSIARKVTESPENKEPVLREGSKSYEGIEEINTFLDEYELFMKDWYDCRCDKWD